MDLGIKGKKALVCAASEGLGRAIAQALADEGVDLFICSRDKDAIADVAAAIAGDTGVEVRFDACDLTDAGSRDALVRSVSGAYGKLDILVHNVGGPKPTTALATGAGEWESGFHRLFQSVAHLNRAFLPAMIEQEWGRIVAVTSLSVIEPIPNLAVSNAMRAAVTGMLKTLADEVARYNVSVNCVAPGVIHTARTEERIKTQIEAHGGTREEYLDEYVRSIPAGRLGSPEEFGAVVAFLCSQQSAYITGSTVCVDGGKRRCV